MLEKGKHYLEQHIFSKIDLSVVKYLLVISKSDIVHWWRTWGILLLLIYIANCAIINWPLLSTSLTLYFIYNIVNDLVPLLIVYFTVTVLCHKIERASNTAPSPIHALPTEIFLVCCIYILPMIIFILFGNIVINQFIYKLYTIDNALNLIPISIIVTSVFLASVMVASIRNRPTIILLIMCFAVIPSLTMPVRLALLQFNIESDGFYDIQLMSFMCIIGLYLWFILLRKLANNANMKPIVIACAICIVMYKVYQYGSALPASMMNSAIVNYGLAGAYHIGESFATVPLIPIFSSALSAQYMSAGLQQLILLLYTLFYIAVIVVIATCGLGKARSEP